MCSAIKAENDFCFCYSWISCMLRSKPYIGTSAKKGGLVHKYVCIALQGRQLYAVLPAYCSPVHLGEDFGNRFFYVHCKWKDFHANMLYFADPYHKSL